MEAKIIADRYYDRARSFIQDHIQDVTLPESFRNKMSEYYQNLDMHNAQDIYQQVYKGYQEQMFAQRRDFEGQWIAASLKVAAIGAGIGIGGYVLMKVFTPRNEMTAHKVLTKMQWIGASFLVLGLCGVCA